MRGSIIFSAGIKRNGKDARGDKIFGILTCFAVQFCESCSIIPPEEMQITSAPLVEASRIIDIDSLVLPEALLTTTIEWEFTKEGIFCPRKTTDGILPSEHMTSLSISQEVPEPPIPQKIIES